MTLLFIDGFDTKDVLAKWVATTNISGPPAPIFTVTTRFGAGYAVSFSTPSVTTQEFYRIARSFTPSAQVFLGAAIQTGIRGGMNYSVPFHLLFGDTGATAHLYLIATSVGAIQVWRGDGRILADSSTGQITPNGTRLATSAAGVIDTGWHYVEFGATLDATTGTAVVKVDNVQVISFTGNTKNGGTSANLDAIMFQAASFYWIATGWPTLGTTVVDDLYICNALGSSNNTFLNDCRVQTLLPDGAGSSTQFTPTGSGSNYLNVNEVPDNSATFNGSSTVGQRDTYAMGDVNAGTTTVVGIQQVMRALKSDAGTAGLKAAQKSGSTVSYGTTRSLSTTAVMYLDLFETNPATSVAYTATEVNALEAGAEVA